VNALILDDIKISREGLATILQKIDPTIHITASCGSLDEARFAFRTQHFDIAFLDIQLQDGTSFELIEDISFETKIVFITAYDEHAIEAIRNGAFDYLLKPINTTDLRNCIQRIQDIVLQNEQISHSPAKALHGIEVQQNMIGISSVESIDFINIDEMIYLEADGKYTKIITEKETIISSKNLKIFETVLPESVFMRVHHSYLLNLSFVKKFQKDVSLLVLKKGTQIPVSKARKELLMQRLLHV
jgi:two-component system LytT family response regulator